MGGTKGEGSELGERKVTERHWGRLEVQGHQ